MPTLLEVAELDGAYPYPVKGEEIKASGNARPAYYAVTALVDGEV